jgi:tetratricopeptide (TPR) repeat protein
MMKNFLLIPLIAFSSSLFSQTPSDLKFTTTVPDAENHWVVFQKSEDANDYNVGFIYFDESAGYSLRSLGTLVEENGKLKYREDQETKNAVFIKRLENLEYQYAVISPKLLKDFNLPPQPEWLKSYLSTASKNEKNLNRASMMNGVGFSKMALPRLENLYKSNFKTDKLYFELAFAYNALGEFSKAEKICSEAINNKIFDDLINKEYVYSLLHQEKVSEADVFLTKNLDRYKNKSYKYEAMMNMIVVSAQLKNIPLAKKWLELFKNSNDPDTAEYIKKFEELIAAKENG